MRSALSTVGRALGWAVLAFLATLAVFTIHLGGPANLFVGMALIGVVLSSLFAAGLAFVGAILLEVLERSWRRRRNG